VTLPNFLVVGASRCGSTTLFDRLVGHPDVFGSAVKETRYFQPVRYGEPLAAVEDYEKFFRGYAGEPVVMEATPDYLYGGRATAVAVDATCSQARVAVILREPVGRAVSFFRFLQSRLAIPADLSFADYVDRCAGLPAAAMSDRSANAYTGIQGGHYADFLGDWIDAFGDRLRVLFFDDLVADQQRLLAATYRWLGVDPAAAPVVDAAADNSTVHYRSARAQRAAAAVSKAARPVWVRFPGTQAALRRLYERVNSGTGTRPDIAPETLDRLRADYAPSLARLREQLSGPVGVIGAVPDWLG
jgi:hypothetical protein